MAIVHVNRMFAHARFMSLVVFFSLIILLSFSKFAVGQTIIWSEDFPEGNNTRIDPEGRWTLNPSNTNNFSIQNNELRAQGSIDGTWTSESINISGHAYISLSANIRAAGNMEISDYIRLEYNVDGGSWNTFETNGYIQDNFGSAIATQNNLSGNSLVLRIRMVNSQNSEYYYVDNITVTGSDNPVYCASNGTMQYDDGITLVNFNTINNSTEKEAGYNDYTSISTDIIIGHSYNLTVNLNTDGDYINYAIAWIDWDKNGIFDTNEEYNLGFVNNSTNGITSNSPLSVLVPLSTTPGSTLMRVSTEYNEYPTACEISFDGEVEDYAINILSPCNMPDTPVLSASSQTICKGESTDLTIISGNLNEADHWQWYSGSCGGTPVGQGTSITVSPTVTTTYYARGEGNCEGTNCGSITVTVNSPPVPDYAGTVTNTTCPSSSDGAVSINSLPTALEFARADDDYVNLGSNFLSDLSAFTLEGWIKVNKSDIGNRIGIFGQNDAIEFGFIDNSTIHCWTAGGGEVNVSSLLYPDDNEWHHIAAVGNGSNITVYIDGLAVGTGGSSTSNYGSSSDAVKIGSHIYDGLATTNIGFTGQIVKAGFYGTALSATQISDLASGFTNYVSGGDLIAGYNFFEGSGTTIASLPSVNNGSFVNSPTWINLYTFSWTQTGDGSFSATTKNLLNLSSGEYNLTVGNENCSRTKSFAVGYTNDVPALGTIDSSSAFCEGDSYNPTAPSVNDNGSPVSAQGWEIESSAGTGSFIALTVPYTMDVSDEGKKVRYFATNSCGTEYSNEIIMTVNPLPATGEIVPD